MPVPGPRGGLRPDLDAVFRREYPLVVAVAGRMLGSRDSAAVWVAMVWGLAAVSFRRKDL